MILPLRRLSSVMVIVVASVPVRVVVIDDRGQWRRWDGSSVIEKADVPTIDRTQLEFDELSLVSSLSSSFLMDIGCL